MEANINEYISDIDEAINLYKQYGEVFPNDLEVKFRLAILNFNKTNFSEVDSFLDAPPLFEKLSLDQGLELAFLMRERGRFLDSMNLMYELRRKYFDQPDAHLKYIGSIMLHHDYPTDWSEIDCIEIDSVVTVQDEDRKDIIFIIEDRLDPDSSKNEYTIDHPIVKQLLGKTIGDTIILRKGEFSEEVGTIKEIKNKFIYALHDSMQNFQKLFPDVAGLEMVRFGDPVDKDALMKSLKPMLEHIKERQLHWRKVTEFYKQGRASVGMLVHVLRSDEEIIYNSLIGDENVGIRYCKGTPEERERATIIIESNPEYVVDLTAIFTIFGIELEDQIIKGVGEFSIAQKTIDKIKEIYEKARSLGIKEYLILGTDGDQPTRTIISEDVAKKRIEGLERMIDWVEKNCKVIPVEGALNYAAEEKSKLNEMLGESFIDSILIAQQSQKVLYSDDLALRIYGENLHNVEGVWTQPLLYHVYEREIIDSEQYNEATIRLACSNFYHTSITSDILLHAAEMAKWLPDQPFICTVKMLGGRSTSLNSAMDVSLQFLQKLWNRPVISIRMGAFIQTLLVALLSGRTEKRKIISRFLHLADAHLQGLPFLKDEIRSVISAMERSGLFI